jgi:hypothetical protein
MDPTLSAIVVVITFIIALYIMVDFFASTLITSTSETAMFVAVAGVPKALAYDISSVSSLSMLVANTSTNSSIVPGNATLVIIGSPASAASLEVIHDAGDAGRDVFVNGYNVGALTAAASDTFAISVLYLVAGDNLVDVR